ncbi:hypothetical protein ATO6_19805 [Oceanicola sp. 22II-s10i]|uniref:TRAP transporter substrate-binding protein DctP n=1 Tax=Oceanicola sp. 22II-s10i TaxID=1317116 RepID=UPI000B526895|nr:TRAP transporter substrate-binding protein DctP [Oceanicola sp. 22II-s10i]OWU83110.1 hypothetical protein ATO6_19805 [Oceanicola sp. 22II-s10i]
MNKKLMTGMLAGIALTLGAGAASAQTVLRYAEYSSDRGLRAEQMQWFAEQLNERTEGRVSIEFFWGGSLLPAREILGGISTGVVDMGTIAGVYNPRELNELLVGDVPIRVDDMWAASRAMLDMASEEGSILDASFDELNIMFNAVYPVGPTQLVCTGDDIKSAADLEGKRILTFGALTAPLEKVGAKPVSITISEAFSGLSSGLLDCTVMYTYAVTAYRLHEVTGQLVNINFISPVALGMAVNQDSLARLSEEDQATFRELGVELTDRLSQFVDKASADVQAQVAEGVDGHTLVVNEFTTEDSQKLWDAGAPDVQKWVDESAGFGFDGAALRDTFLERVEAYEAEKDDKGYPWER